MPLKLYNTLTRKKEIFKPINGNSVGMYTCGPTVYDFAHIGNFRAYVCSDVLKRYLKYKGFDVRHVMNITDIDDKTINGANREGISLKDYTSRYEKAFFEDLQSLKIQKADVFPRATEHIREMIEIIKKLLGNNTAYKSEDGSVYYDISKFKGYGKLSHSKIKALKEGARVRQDSYEKDEAKDFALWKAYSDEDGDVFWDTQIGKGRPGWHIECSAMSMKHLGEHFDIHAGGIDLTFPHHENEIAQSEASTGKKFVNYWVHNEHLLVDGQKMSKSLGNFYTLRDLLKNGNNARAVRYLLLCANYRAQLNFTQDALNAADSAVQRLNDFLIRIEDCKDGMENLQVKQFIQQAKNQFEAAMDDDLNISTALSHVFDFMKKINTLMMNATIAKEDAKKVTVFMQDIDKVLCVMDGKKAELGTEMITLVEEREKARAQKNFKKADEIRYRLMKQGIVLEDTKDGVRWKKL